MTKDPAQGFEAFYEEWFGRVYNYARHRTGSAIVAEEITADTFARALHSWSKLDPERGDARSWLFSIAFRSVADYYRSQRRRRWFSLDFLTGASEGGDSGRELEQAEEESRLMAALGRLSDQQREILSLKFYAGMTNRAIATLLGLEESNVGVILFRAVRRIRQSEAGAEVGHG